jgi:hypothetical protein
MYDIDNAGPVQVVLLAAVAFAAVIGLAIAV